MKKPLKIEMARRDRLKAVEELAPRFFIEVIGMNFFDCLITDESDLRDFAGCNDLEVSDMLDRFEAHYLINGREAQSTRIVDLLEFLQGRGVIT